MRSPIEAIADRTIGTVESVHANAIRVLVDPSAPHVTALNSGMPMGFPRINGYLLVPNESGATVGIISAVQVERLPYPKRKGIWDSGLIDLPFPARLVTLTPLGTLLSSVNGGSPESSFEMRRGVDIFPTAGDPVLLPSPIQLRALVEGEIDGSSGQIHIGTCPTANGSSVHVNPDKLFGRHLAVLGNTGAGKSCTVAGLIRWSVEAARDKHQQKKPNARFIILDPNGEYARAFQDLKPRVFKVDGDGAKGTLRMKVPAWLWNGAEWAAFTGAAPGVQRPILFEALRMLRSGIEVPDIFESKVRARVNGYRSQIRVRVQNCDHMTKGKREGFADLLKNLAEDFRYLISDATGELKSRLEETANLSSDLEESKKTPPDWKGKIWHRDFSYAEVGKLQKALDAVAQLVGLSNDDSSIGEDLPIRFSVQDLPEFVEAIAATSTGRDVSQFVDSLSLRIRGMFAAGPLASITRPDLSEPKELDEWLDEYVGADQAKNEPLAILDLSLVPSEAVHVIVAVLGRMIFEAIQRHRKSKGYELPTVLVLDEAHTFIHKGLNSDTSSAPGQTCCQTFERISREGRKFGLGLVLASQRPSEISPTILSQCNTFLLHRIVNDKDQDLVKRLVPDGLGDLLRELPSLPSRRAIMLGWGAPAPLLTEMRELREECRPHSPDPAFWEVWTGKKKCTINWKKVADSWVKPRTEEMSKQV